MVASPDKIRPIALANWLFAVAVMVIVMVAVGGITRLTESGLSITEWKPITGAIPPLSEAAWQAEFDLYKATGEYKNVTGPAGMDLAAFKFIYFWEWFHRLWGRLIGLAFALPLAWFWVRGAIPQGYKLRLVGLLALGGLQGVFGWFMVKSGLNETMTDVSHFMLSLHFMTAMITLAALVWTALDFRRLAAGHTGKARWTATASWVGALLFIQLVLAAWVAGLNAGLASDSWPLMQGRLIPEFDASRGLFYAMTHDPYLVHWLHRWWAWVVVAALIVMARKVKPIERRASVAIHSAFGTQILLGIATVMTGVALWLAVAHQVVGALLVASFTWAAHLLGRKA
ncbi:COX15/CtaA family protein [Qipengyuania gaetbuli]|uniref:COX15/CtaA family protein n=1 Tax=Qipengyuania gaetbuli TaxID=266952 RepID=UPI001CFCE42E|nr:COX15/CtaA family protein [Qipengyuania gaetbuli]